MKKKFLSIVILGLFIATALQTVGTDNLTIDENIKNSSSEYYFTNSDYDWSITEVVSTESHSNSRFPSLDVESDGTIHIAWYDYTNYGVI